jgi:LysR family transcriptional regulator, hydrogen peroxide-inducible genes activator
MAFAPHPFTLRQLQYVAAVAQALSFRRAAALCHVSQPSLSTQLTQVEEALGIRLFERGRRRVLVTAMGRDFVERAKRLLRDADELVQAGRRAADPFSGTVRLGVIPTISPYLVPSLTAHLKKTLPRLRVQWAEETTAALLEKLADGSIEAAILALEAGVGDLERESIATDRFVLVTRPEHPLAKKSSPVSTAELRDEEVLLLAEGHCFRDQALDLCQRAHASEGEFRATSLCTLAQMVSSGGGITLLPTIAVDLEAKRAGLHVRPIAGSAAHRTIGLVWRKGMPSEGLMHAIAKAMREAYPGSSVGPTSGRRARAGRTRPSGARTKTPGRR